jgi:type IV pilus assembly protein PilE
MENRMMKRTRGPQQGLTLIELMIVVAIAAILAAIGYPSYVEQVAKGRRADAKAVLLENAQWLERTFTESGAYNKAAGGTTIAANPTATSSSDTSSLPSGLREAPKDGGTKYYYIRLEEVTANSFTLRAVRKGVQATDKCGDFTITNAGVKGLTSNASSMTVDSCWNR